MLKQINSLNKRDLFIIIVVFLGLIILNIPLMIYIREIGYQNSKETMKLRLEKYSEEIESNIFEPVKNSINSLSGNFYLQNLLDQNSNLQSETYNRVNLLMKNAKEILNANAVYLMDQTGEVIASTNYGNSSESFLGNNYNFRPYFQKALQGEKYIYGAVGKTSGERGFYFSSPVQVDDQIQGVLVVKIALNELDQILNEFKNEIVLLSPENVVFSANSEDYLYQVFNFDGQQKIDDKQLKQQFGIENSTFQQLSFSDDNIKFEDQNYLFEKTNLNITGWSLASFKEVESFFYGRGNEQLFFIICIVIILLGIIIVALLINQFYRMKLEKELRKFSKTVEQSPVSSIITDLDGHIEYVNQSFEEVTGYRAQEVLGKNPNLLKTDYHSQEFYEDLWETITSGETWEGEFYNQKKNGDYYWEKAKITPLFDKSNNIEAFIGIKEDITEEKKMQEKLEFFAERDELTDLYNRRVGTQLIREQKKEVDSSEGYFSLAFIDINNLKFVNDVYGHEAGDELIVTVVDKIKDNIRSSDVVARFGGDEFIIIFVDAKANDAEMKLELIQEKFQRINEVGEYNYPISISYGVEEYSNDRELSVDELISMADSKMYKFKKEYKKSHDLPNR